MIAAEDERHGAGRGRLGDRGGDQGVVAVRLGERQVAESSRRMSTPSSSPDSAAMLPWSEQSAARISGGACGGAAQEGGVAVGRRADQPQLHSAAVIAPSSPSAAVEAGRLVQRSRGSAGRVRRGGRLQQTLARLPAGPSSREGRLGHFRNPSPRIVYARSTSRIDMLQPPRPDLADARPGFREFVVLIAGADGAERAGDRRDGAGASGDRRGARRRRRESAPARRLVLRARLRPRPSSSTGRSPTGSGASRC